jgi:hypothetical protein
LSDVSVGRSGFQDSLFSLEKYQQTMDNADTEMERSDESIRHTFREQTAQQQFHHQLVYTNYLTLSDLFMTIISSHSLFYDL